MILIGTYILVGVAIVGVGIFTIMQVDEFFYKRKRIREINERHEERMLAMAERNAEFMLRIGMNPAFMINNATPGGMVHTLCTASRNPILTAQREAMMAQLTELTDLPVPAVYTPEEAIATELSVHWNERIKESLPDDAEVHSVEASIPEWDGTFIHLDENEDAMKRLSKRTDVPIPDWEDVPTKIPDDEPIPAPALFMLETVNKLKEICDDRETDDQSD